MKVSELKRYLKANGCRFVEEGAKHEIWVGINGHEVTIKRQKSQEIGTKLFNDILKQAGLK